MAVILIAVLVGGVFGWVIRGEGVVGEQVREIDSERGNRRSIVKARGDHPKKVDFNEEIDWERLRAMDSEELRDLLNDLQGEGGLYGLSNKAQRWLENGLVEWFEKDPEEALEWVKNIARTKDRVTLLTKICEKVVEGDLDEGIAFVKVHLATEESYLLPPMFIQKAGKVSADKLLEVTRLGMSWSGGIVQFVAAEYPNGFDFQKALEGIENQLEAYKHTGANGSRPSDLLKEWVKVDPEASYEWLKASGKNTSESKLGEYLRGFSEVRSSAEVGEFLGNHLSGKKGEYRDYLLVSDGLARKAEPGVLEAFYEHAGGDKVTHAAGILGSTGDFSLHAPRVFETVLGSLSESEQRTVLNAEYMQKRLGHQRARQNVENSLIASGRSSEEVAAMLPPAKKE